MKPILLDVTRTIRTTRENATGIDRVERAYIRHLANNPRPHQFFAALGRGCAFFRAEDAENLISTQPPKIEYNIKQWVSILLPPQFWGTSPNWSGSYARLPSQLSSQFSDGFHYVNVGHTHLSSRMFRQLRAGGAAKMVVLLHDTIPLDHPETQTAKSVRRFRRRFDAATRHADLILANSDHTADRIRHWAGRGGRHPSVRVAPLGVDPAPDVTAHHSDAPYFVQLGTVEPRKNHAMLLDIWDSFGDDADAPHLHIIGRWGWKSENLRRRFENSPLRNRTVFHHDTLRDEEVGAYLRGARALLFPSLAEGFGFPLFEALQLGVPVICTPLPAFKERVPVGPLYTESRDVKAWTQQIKRLADASRQKIDLQGSDIRIPRWDAHFEWINELP